MRVLVVHAWLKGNLGDVLQLSVLLSALRDLKPERLDLAGYPSPPAPETADLLALADRCLPDPFPWYWSLVPSIAGSLVLEPWWRAQRRKLFSRYDALVCAPGPYLASYDPRAVSAISDIAVASELGLRVVLASHSIGPLGQEALATVRRAALSVARESATHAYLGEHGIPSVSSADLAFLYPYRPTAAGHADAYRLVFLRSNNLDARALRLKNGALFHGSELIVDAAGQRLVLATSDRRRDERFLERAGRRLELPWVVCRSVQHMVDLVAGSTGVVSDRYHPAICAAVLGKPAHVLPNREPHKMHGLQNLLAARSVGELQALAREGLRAVTNTLEAL